MICLSLAYSARSSSLEPCAKQRAMTGEHVETPVIDHAAMFNKD